MRCANDMLCHIMVFFGTLFFAVANDYGFVAPVLAARAPAMLDAINAYPPVAAMNGLLIVGFFVGLILFGMVTLRAGVFPRQIGMLLAVGSPMYVIAGALGQLVYEPLWTFAILGALEISAGLLWAGYTLWSNTKGLVVPAAA